MDGVGEGGDEWPSRTKAGMGEPATTVGACSPAGAGLEPHPLRQLFQRIQLRAG